jgi:putative SOS response-associated peptidase YedK
MCGRYTIKTPLHVIADLFEVETELPFVPHYNVAPTQEVPVVRLNKEHHRELVMMRWGLVPFWAKDPKIGNSLINARVESVTEKPAFKNAFQRRRCLVAADGFYEWKKDEGKKQPYWIYLKNGEPFAFAGLWEHWKSEEKSITSFTILTTTPNAFTAELHDRMPVILPKEAYDVWLNGDAKDVSTILKPFEASEMAAHPVSTVMNSARVDDPSCIAPLNQPTKLVIKKA